MIRPLWTRLLTVAAAALAVTAVSQAQNVITNQVRPAVRNGQAPLVGPMAANQTMHLTVVLPLRNQDGLDNLLEQLYDPNSPSYHQFLTVEQFTAQFGPTQDDYNTTIAYLEEHGFTVTGTSTNRVIINVSGPVSAVNSAFHVKMGQYHHPSEGRNFYAPDRQPTVDLNFPLWNIAGLDNYSIPHPAGLNKRPTGSAPNATTGSGPSASFLGSDMRAAYYVDNNSSQNTLTGAGQSLGLLEYYGTDLVDLSTYFSNVGQTNNVPITLVSTDGTSTNCVYSRFSRCDDIEQTLDMTQALGMAPGLANLVMYVGSTDAAIFNAMATDTTHRCAQLSSSWTWSPADPSTDDPFFKTFAAQGQNLFQAAGDSGAWTSGSSIYPADDVYLTSVGGTDLNTSSAGGPWSSESTWVDGGGGISPNKFALPSWQTNVVAGGCSSCSSAYRNAPDVSANANFTFYVCGDQKACTANYYGGTSFAAPMWAGYLALVNQQAVANGKSVVGFINPTLYSIGAGSNYNADFHDVTSGSNGYSATTGYDLATGWGSPNGASLITALLGGTTTTPSYTLSASPSSVSIAQGSGGSSTITVTPTGGFSSTVSLSASGQPSGVTFGFSPSSITGGSGTSTMNITVGSTVTPGTYPITVSGTDGTTTQTTTVSLTVTGTANPSFTLSVSPSSLNISRGKSSSATVSSTISGGFSSSISLSESALPPGVTTTNFPASISAGGSATFTINVSSSASVGNYTITITGTGGGVTQTTSLSLHVKQH